MSIVVGKVASASNWERRPKFWFLLAIGATAFAACGSSSSAGANSTKSSASSNTGLGSSTRTSSTPIKVGVMTNDTGPYAALGTPLRDGIQMVFDQINQAGGIGGRKIDAIYEDGQTNPNTAVTEAHQLVSDHAAMKPA